MYLFVVDSKRKTPKESEININRNIDSEDNIITHCGIEYFITNYYNNYNAFNSLLLKNDNDIINSICLNICLINIDFHYRNIILNNKDNNNNDKNSNII